MMGDMASGTGLSYTLMFEGLFLAVSIGVISGVVPAYRASKLKPVDALRYE
jgi:putative ABC transport system permease protein